MANVNRSRGGGTALQVSRSSCETARDRYHAPKNMRIGFEHMAPFLFEDDVDDDDENDDDQDNGLEDHPFDNDLVAHIHAGMQDHLLQIQNDDGSEDEWLFEIGDEAHIQANTQEAVQLLQLEGQVLDEQFEDDVDDVESIQDILLEPTDDSDLEQDSDIEDELDSPSSGPDADAHHMVPMIARWRLNLTALSQKYNLYFAAYREKIHVSRPRSCVTHNLPAVPDIVLRPGSSAAARSVGGTIEPAFPHQVNHLIIGDFGEKEILLMAYDDGDVIAYYTAAIEDEIARRERYFHGGPFLARTRPFFQENVQISVWGLAIHSKSRLIAVGSNLHTVTVFIPALTSHPNQPVPEDANHLYNTVHKNASGVPVAWNVNLDQDNAKNEDWIRRRDANWIITLDTRPQGDNIPNVTFSSDKLGGADNVVAIDVKGNIWLMPIWSFGTASRRIPAIHRGSSNTLPGHIGRPRGWGIIVISGGSFLPAQGPQGLLGLGENEVRFASHPGIGKWLDTSKSIKYIPQNSTQYPWAGAGRRERLAHSEFNRLIDNEWWFSNYSTTQRDKLSPSKHAILADRDPTRRPRPVLADGASILRLYETDIELRSHEEDGVGIVMQHATKQIQARPAGLPALRSAHERLSNNHYVPELSLVVAGSMCGRVALITLTKTVDGLLFSRGFKVEAILPTKKDEEDHLRPTCPLFGVAIGPLPVDGERNSPPRFRRYRIMLQYYDQRILSYEISRGTGSEGLIIM